MVLGCTACSTRPWCVACHGALLTASIRPQGSACRAAVALTSQQTNEAQNPGCAYRPPYYGEHGPVQANQVCHWGPPVGDVHEVSGPRHAGGGGRSLR